MLTGAMHDNALKSLTRNGWLLFLTRFTRLFAYGALSVVLVLYLTGLGLSESQTGMLLTLTLVGDTFVSLFLSPPGSHTRWPSFILTNDQPLRASRAWHL